MCPAVIFANRRIIKATGFMISPNTSTMAKIGLTKVGIPGIHKVCFQKSLFPLIRISARVNNPKETVTAIFPVTLAAPGNKPKRFVIQIKKNTVNKNGMNFIYFFSPICGLAISSRTKSTKVSSILLNPAGAFLFFLWCPARLKKKNKH